MEKIVLGTSGLDNINQWTEEGLRCFIEMMLNKQDEIIDWINDREKENKKKPRRIAGQGEKPDTRRPEPAPRPQKR